MSVNPSTSQFPGQLIPIVAIGASTGGLEAVLELLASLPPTTGLAYVYIQSANGPGVDRSTSAVSSSENAPLALLRQATTMPVVEAQDQVTIEPNHVYVILSPSNGGKIAPDADLEVIDNVLTLAPRRQISALVGEMPIDRFFLSLADRQRSGAIAVLLSGTASDGTLGMRAIRASGGLTFAQDQTARFQSMPRTAIIDGVVDRVMPPGEIARELEQLSQRLAYFRLAAGANSPEKTGYDLVDLPQKYVNNGQENTDVLVSSSYESGMEEAPELMDSIILGDEANVAEKAELVIEKEDLREIIQLLCKATGNDFTHYKKTTIRRRIIRRMLLFRFRELKDYTSYLRQNANEIKLLYEDLLINVTTFFRDAEIMNYLRQELLPQLVKHKEPYDSLRIWVPAC
ncbi:MAG: hypothetical protein JWP57_611, partial [Spirosoma sp.]|nr:hypothetical protein [Spirosoma sp.]